jgi:murein DD-endopeptidase MepM/ murein hydrolase activator NlpD
MVFTGFHCRSVVAIAAALTVGVGAVAYDQVRAAPTDVARLEIAATALKPAKRLSFRDTLQSGPIMFPMNPSPTCYLSKTSFGQPRANGTRSHEGIDLMASLGQDIYAVDNGVLWKQAIDGPTALLSGNAWYLKLPDGTYYFYAHLSAFASGLKVGDTVTRGQVIGYVGDTGDPGPGNYHLHFEVHPNGGAAVDPFPLLTIPSVCKVSA